MPPLLSNAISTTAAPAPLLPPTGRLVPYTGQAVPTAPRSIDYTKPQDMLQLMGSQGQSLIGEGEEWLGGGREALQPVLAYLMKLLSGDEGALAEAIRPEVQGVVSQYDAARRAMAEFTPRGGGQVSAQSQLRAAEAGDLAALSSTARRSAVGELSRLGLGQAQVGTNLSSVGFQGLGNVLQGALSEAQSKRQMWADLGVGIGAIAASIFAPPLGALLAAKWGVSLPTK